MQLYISTFTTLTLTLDDTINDFITENIWLQWIEQLGKMA